ncbi:DDB1- and CUL4-associated factor 13 [Penaeus vannamei]|uniref:DDB1-and CUL4-associated factor 13 n=1 Tax=Penaeus vannamei TaxID=6689 RepID=A0A423SGX7_PENVA|nr:DDB1- and CUL4-associated factor 13 [Penaeus vannamei]
MCLLLPPTVQRNYDPTLHPFEAAREYKLAVNAVKLERVFAKPFVSSLTHSDALSAICRHPSQLSSVFTGTVEGELMLWDLPQKKSKWSVQAHNGHLGAIVTAPDGGSFFTVGNDKTIKRWSLEKTLENSDLPVDTWMSETVITGISHHRYNNEFITCGERVFLWDATMKAPKFSYDWNTGAHGSNASVVCVKFNDIETSLFASSDQANNIILYDTRGKEHRIVGLHEGHTSAVTDVYYSPTGKEFVSGSYDRSIRIFSTEEGKCRDVYHTKRMFKVNCVLWTADNKYVLSGSSDHNVRIWKSVASEKMGVMREREQSAINYAEELKKKYSSFPEVKRIQRHRHLPGHIYHAKKEHAVIKESKAIRQANLRKHSKTGAVPHIPVKQRPVVGLVDEQEEKEEKEEKAE